MKYTYWLASRPISSIKKNRLCWDFISAISVFEAKEKEFERLDYLSKKDIDILCDSFEKERCLKEYEKIKDEGINFVSILSEDYPARLRNIYNPPFALFYKGNLPKEDGLKISIVGARVCSTYGQHVTEQLGEILGELGVDVISGMAKGIDSAAHNGALKGGGRTYGVLGCGPDICYPRQNQTLYKEIINTGAVISEYPPGTLARPEFFPQRNRIISGLSDVVIITEAKEKSGSLITGDIALEQGKEIYCVPGRIGDALSAGTNNLIHQGAGIITSIEQLLVELKLAEGPVSQKKRKLVELSKEETILYKCIDCYPKEMGVLLNESGLTLIEMFSVISSLGEKGLIRETFKNNYVKC